MKGDFPEAGPEFSWLILYYKSNSKASLELSWHSRKFRTGLTNVPSTFDYIGMTALCLPPSRLLLDMDSPIKLVVSQALMWFVGEDHFWCLIFCNCVSCKYLKLLILIVLFQTFQIRLMFILIKLEIVLNQCSPYNWFQH